MKAPKNDHIVSVNSQAAYFQSRYHISQILLFSLLFPLASQVVYACTSKCEEAKNALEVLTLEWTKEVALLEIFHEAKLESKKMRSEFDNVYFRYMSSEHSLDVAKSFKVVETGATAINNLIGLSSPFGQATNRIFKGRKLSPEDAQKMMDTISFSKSYASEGFDYAMASLALSKVPGSIGGITNTLLTLYLDVNELVNFSDEQQKGIEEMKNAVKRLDGLIEEYEKKVQHSEYMIDQYAVVKKEFDRIIGTKCGTDLHETPKPPCKIITE